MAEKISRRAVLKAGLGLGAAASLVAEGYSDRKDLADLTEELMSPNKGHVWHHRNLEGRVGALEGTAEEEVPDLDST